MNTTQKNMIIKTACFFLVIFLGIGSTSCGTSNTGTTNFSSSEKTTLSSEQGTVRLYSSMQEEQLLAIKQSFEKKYPEIKMDYYFAGTTKVITKIATEAQTGQVNADVIWVAYPADYVSLKSQNILQKYISEEMSAIDPAYIDAEGYYIGARMMNMGIAYNTTLVTPEEAPKSWDDLLDPKWYGQIVMTDPGSSGTSKYWRNAMMCNDQYGVAYIQKLKDNGCSLESGTATTHSQLAAGAYKVGICLDYVTANLASEGFSVAFVYPNNTLSIYSPIGLVNNCANEANGKLLYDFILSNEGQTVLTANNLISVRNDIEQGGSYIEAITGRIMAVDITNIASNEDANAEAFDKIFGL